MPFDVIIVGGGIVGWATVYRLRERRHGWRLWLLEKAAGVARHQPGHNSGVLHAGLYYRPGTEKARLSVEGLKQMVEFCREHGIVHEQCGKIVVATSEAEVARSDTLMPRGAANGLEGLRELTGP